MSKHSPGPWKWDDYDDATELPPMDGYLRDANGSPIVFGEDAGPDWPRTADARLLAAAPELLELVRAWATGDASVLIKMVPGDGPRIFSLRDRSEALIKRIEEG